MYYDKIFGWFNEGHQMTYDFFVENSSENKEMNILEIGCFLGRSSMYIAEKIKLSNKPIKLHCVDYFMIRDKWPKNKVQRQDLINKFGYDLLPQFNNHIKSLDVENIVIPYQMSSNEALDYFINNNFKFDYIFIDGGHDYDIVKNDIEKSLKIIKDTGIIGGDDYFTSRENDQVQKAVDEIFGKKVDFINEQTWLIKLDKI